MCTDDGQGGREPHMKGECVVVRAAAATVGPEMQTGVVRDGQAAASYRQPIIEARMGAGAGWNSPEL